MARTKFVATYSVTEAAVSVGVHAASCKHYARTGWPVLHSGHSAFDTLVDAVWRAETDHPDLEVRASVQPCAR